MCDRLAKPVSPPINQIAPLPVSPAKAEPRERETGEESLRRGEVAALIVAGGQGSRLGFDKPKGMYPVGPVSGSSLFQIHAEKVLALSRRTASRFRFLVMTSPATDADTRDYFRENRYFGLTRADVIFFQQGTMPTVLRSTGRLLLEARGQALPQPERPRRHAHRTRRTRTARRAQGPRRSSMSSTSRSITRW